MPVQLESERAAAGWLKERQQHGSTQQEALAFFDSLPPVHVDALIGRWRGSGLRTGHALDGRLEELGWYGKEFQTVDKVHPLLFTDRSGAIVAMESRFLPVGLLIKAPGGSAMRTLFAWMQPLLRTTKPRARIRMMEHRGKLSATMIYDFLPIHDVFRRVDENTLLGIMDLRGMPEPFFFVLRRE